MLRLFIDTGNPVSNVALFQGSELLVGKQNTVQQDHGKVINLQIQALFDEQGVAMKALQEVWVVTGPGSYTGLRIAMATAKGISYALGIPLYGISMFNWLQRTVQQTQGLEDFGMMSLARTGEFFVASASSDMTQKLAPSLMMLDDLQILLNNKHKKWFTYQAFPHDFVLDIAECLPAIHVLPSFFDLNSSGFELDVMLAEPLYLKNVHINKINNL